MSTRETAAGVIYDIGYRKYEGARLGRGYAFRTLYLHSLRTAWGIGRGARSKIIPFLLLAGVSVPALVQVVISAVSGGEAELFSYANYFNFTQFMVALFCAAQAAELVSTDQQHRVLPLYFSRALRRHDYAAAKLLAMVSALLILLLVPQLLLFVGRLSLSDEIGAALRAEAPFILPILGSALTAAAVMGTLSLALASLSARRAIASASILGLFLLTVPVAAIVAESGVGERARLLNPVLTIDGVIEWLFEGTARAEQPAEGPPAKPAAGEQTAERARMQGAKVAAGAAEQARPPQGTAPGKQSPPPPEEAEEAEEEPLGGAAFLAGAAVMALLGAGVLFNRYRKVSA